VPCIYTAGGSSQPFRAVNCSALPETCSNRNYSDIAADPSPAPIAQEGAVRRRPRAELFNSG